MFSTIAFSPKINLLLEFHICLINCKTSLNLDCICNIFGTAGSNETCEPYTGQCQCKINIQGTSCSECKDTFYSFPTNSTGDCQNCGCHIAGGYPVCNKKTGLFDCFHFSYF